MKLVSNSEWNEIVSNYETKKMEAKVIELARKMEIECGINGCKRRRHLTCKACSMKGLTGAAWRLRDHDGVIHGCHAPVTPTERDLPSAPGVKASINEGENDLTSMVQDVDTKSDGGIDGGIKVTIIDATKWEKDASSVTATVSGEATEEQLLSESQGEGEGESQGEQDPEDLAKIIYERVKPYIDAQAEQAVEQRVEQDVNQVLRQAEENFYKQRQKLQEVNKETNEKLVEDLETAIQAGAEEAVEKLTPPIEIQLKKPDKTVTTIKGQHKMFPYLLKLAGARLNIMLVGPAGSGKTRGAEEAAKVLGLGFFPKSLGPATTEHSMMGYQDANGKYVSGILHKPFTDGGVLLLDEIDSANAAAITTLNTALANPYCSFPHKVEDKHADFVVIASGNTYGRGADREYVGRTQLDAATLDRFAVINWDYDKTLEKRIAEGMAKNLGEPKIIEWMEYVHLVRQAIKDTNIRMVASTRSIIDGGIAIASGLSIDEVANLRFWNSIDKDTHSKVSGRLSVLQAEANDKKLKKSYGNA